MTFSPSCRATEWPFWFGLILPFSVIYVFNWVIFALIMIQIMTRKNNSAEKKTTKNARAKQNLIVAVGLSLLCGLGWGFGLTATSSDVKEVTFALQILFSVFVGSQGVLIFFFHGVRSPKFRLVWVSVFRLRIQQNRRMASLHYIKKDKDSSSDYIGVSALKKSETFSTECNSVSCTSKKTMDSTAISETPSIEDVIEKIDTNETLFTDNSIHQLP